MDVPSVVGIDGPESSLEAVDWAADEALRHELPLHLLHAAAADHAVPGMAAASERARRKASAVRLSSEVPHQDAGPPGGRRAQRLRACPRVQRARRPRRAAPGLGRPWLSLPMPTARPSWCAVGRSAGTAGTGESSSASRTVRPVVVPCSSPSARPMYGAVGSWRCTPGAAWPETPGPPGLSGYASEPSIARPRRCSPTRCATPRSSTRTFRRAAAVEGPARQALPDAASDAGPLVVRPP
ncbi:universal stress protein [Streptomyces europaeiscabiei]